MSLTKFIRENLILLLGVVAPVLILAIFFIGASLRQQTEAPRYDALLAVDQTYDYAPPVRAYLFVRDHKLYAQYSIAVHDQGNLPHLYLYDASRKTLRQLDFPPPDLSGPDPYGKQVQVEAARDLVLDASPISPDGYEFTYDSDVDREGGFLNDLFVGGYSSYGPRLRKDGSSVLIASPQPYGQLRFLGWVTKTGATP